MKKINSEDVTVVILAGGRGRRMGGMDKGLIRYNNQPLIKHVIDAISKQTTGIIINANRNLDDYATFGYPVIADSLNDFQGPLAGFLASMEAVNNDYILTLPCDGPFIAENYLQKMVTTMSDSHCDIAVASDGQRMQPVYALIPVSLQQSLNRFLAAGDRKIDLWYAQHDTALVEFNAESQFFTNFNAPSDLENN